MEYINEYISLENDFIIADTGIGQWAYGFYSDKDKTDAIEIITKAIEDWHDEDGHAELECECLGDVIDDYLTSHGILDYEVNYEYNI